jgi:hypothetical protein
VTTPVLVVPLRPNEVDVVTIAVQQDDWRAAAALHIVQAYAVGRHERAPSGVIAFGLGCATVGQQGGACEGNRSNGDDAATSLGAE